LSGGFAAQIRIPIRLHVSLGIGSSDVKPVSEISEFGMSDVEVEIEVENRIGGSVLGDRNLSSGQFVESSDNLFSDSGEIVPELF
jgi:hypothetical protein